MYKINYFQKQLSDTNSISFVMYKELLNNNKITQPIIFCDNYTVDPLPNIPIFHSYFINQHFNKTLVLTDFDQLEYVEYFNNNNFLIVFNKDVHNLDKIHQYETQNKFKFIDINIDINSYMENNYDK